ncbi:MAG: TetM/TetW/TetO/TetS family tetracycline resistance ribosomal protection protein [Clostridium sp.]|nr:TetM/TetW/TetO/TetS family tetracycline resistance ribosomal protection protein [Clostridium sp.]MCM1547810.1 TetM/TetW/TetO/TetS family tetracycline resistance ribosomal protection protein [Ruminococcus sp.]
MKRITAGIFAHVDSGKTTLSEALLYNTGEIRTLGRVDHRNTFLDTNRLERERGITIFSKQARLHFDDMEMTLLDTPGHVDFSPEAERTMQVLDCAVLVISGTDGVQSHTETLWRLLERYNIPVFIFVNKMDLSGADKENVLYELKKRLDYRCVDFTDASADGFFEELAECDEAVMQKFLDGGEISCADIADAVGGRSVFPCCFGSALKMNGVDKLISLISKYSKGFEGTENFGARVFKISEDEQGTRLTHLKITGGSLKVKSVIEYSGASEKVNQIRMYSGEKYHAADEASAGMICAVTGLSKTFCGQGLGCEKDSSVPVLEPVLDYKIEICDDTPEHTALLNLKKLEEEEPQLHIIWNERLREIHAQLMGEVQIEILKSIISERFGMDAEFGQGSIAYKETIAAAVEGVGHYEPLKHYAEVHLILEPLERGSGLEFAAECREDLLDKNWQRLILTHLEEKTHLGVLTGSPITDMKITLVSGKAHLKHTEGGDFRQATYRAVRQGLRCAKSVLLEPWYNFRLELPSENIGRAMSDLQRMNAVYETSNDGENAVITGSAAVSEIAGYQSEINSYTHGRGRIACSLKGYEPCGDQEKIIEEIAYNCDGDVENSADSVFCSHGAGFVVKWDKVGEYMHLESVLKQNADAEEETADVKRAESYCSRLATDKELMEIFERTYGPVKREPREAFRKKIKRDTADTGKARPVPKGPEYLLVDGYNIIYAWDDLKKTAKENLDLARSQLINILCNYQAFRQCCLILVFDAYRVSGSRGEVEKLYNINIVYTKEAETADMYIQKITNDLGREHRVRVATSDGAEQLIILGNGAYRVSASEFYDEVKNVENAIKEYIDRTY